MHIDSKHEATILIGIDSKHEATSLIGMIEHEATSLIGIDSKHEATSLIGIMRLGHWILISASGGMRQCGWGTICSPGVIDRKMTRQYA